GPTSLGLTTAAATTATRIPTSRATARPTNQGVAAAGCCSITSDGSAWTVLRTRSSTGTLLYRSRSLAVEELAALVPHRGIPLAGDLTIRQGDVQVGVGHWSQHPPHPRGQTAQRGSRSC